MGAFCPSERSAGVAADLRPSSSRVFIVRTDPSKASTRIILDTGVMATPNSEAASKEVAQQSGTSIQHNNDLSSMSPCLAMVSQTVPGSSPHNTTQGGSSGNAPGLQIVTAADAAGVSISQNTTVEGASRHGSREAIYSLTEPSSGVPNSSNTTTIVAGGSAAGASGSQSNCEPPVLMPSAEDTRNGKRQRFRH